MLTQEELAEAATLSPRSVSDLERGINRTAHKETARLLADALSLAEPARALFVAAARGRAPAAEVLAARAGQAPRPAAAAPRALPRDIASFTGRDPQLTQLLGAVGSLAASGGVVGIHAIDGMAGIGKTTFAVHAAHRLAPGFPDGQFFLPLHAHTPGQRPVGPVDALASLLLTAGVPAAQIPPGLEARAGRWRDQVAGKKILLLLDDAAGHEQVRPLLPGTAGSLVLVTSRRRLTALEDAAVVSLDILPADEAAALLVRLAARPGLRARDAAVGEITGLCGYLPLAIGMLAGQLRHHPAWAAGELAAELAVARDRLALMRAENLSVGAAFGLSYTDLTPGQQRLFRRLGLVPGPDFDARAVAALDHTSLDEARRCLDELYDQHLITEPEPGRYQLHDLLREHARVLAAADDPADRDAVTGRLLDYYLHTALAAGQHIPAFYPGIGSLPPACPPEYAPSMSTPGQAAGWLEAERANLHATTGHAASSGRHRHAMLIPAAMAGFLHARGHWDQAVIMHQTAVAAARQSGDRAGQARALVQLSEAQFSINDRAAAVAASQQALELYRDLDDRAGQAEALNGLGFVHRVSGDYHAAATCHQQALALYRDLGNRAGQAESLNRLGSVQQETGDYRAAATNHQQALQIFRDLGDRPGQSVVLMELGIVQRLTGDYTAAAATFRQAQEMGRDLDNRYDQAWIRNQLGVLQRLAGDYPAAAASHQQALETLCELGEPAAQGFTRNELGLVQQLTGDYPAAAASHQQALRLLRDAGEPYGQACVLNSLGELASRTSATRQAREQHGQALAIARDIGAPLEEARALEGIGQATSKTATRARPPRICGTHWPSTSASEAPPPSASRKPCADTGRTQPHRNPPRLSTQGTDASSCNESSQPRPAVTLER
jgi:tetratricopeptide (TPR) repeat protein/transcriptional regulator with XRE-family HTH domain